ncbi:MAG: hypothetical protein M3022_03960 [Actinomycetota bacterium]|nr:hypothetical protein [Actinomycetota bacterium]
MLVQGGMRPTTSYADALTATGQTGEGTQTFFADQFKNAGFSSSVPHSGN